MMKRLLVVMLVFVCPAFATTKIRLHDSVSAIANCKAMDLSFGPPQISQVTSVTTTTVAGNDIQATKTAGGTAQKWCTEPFSSTTTISGTITFNFYVKESATTVNATIRAKLVLYHSGAETTTISDCGFATELTASIAAKNWTTASGGWTACAVTSTSLSVGDRVVLYVFINGCTTTCTVASAGMAAGSVTMDYDGPTDAADGSSWVQLNETETFSVESGAPAIVVTIHTRTGTGWSVTDDGGNTYNLGPACAPGETMLIFYALNAANARKITVTHSGGTVVYFADTPKVFSNIAIGSALDVSTAHCADGVGGATVTAGSFTPLVSGDVLYQPMFSATWPETTAYSTATQGSCAWALIDTVIADAQASQWCSYASTSAINPTMTRADTVNDSYSMAIALKSSGGTPSLVRWGSMPNMSNVGQSSAAGASMSSYLPDPALTTTTGMYAEEIQHEVYEFGRVTPLGYQFTSSAGTIIYVYYGGSDSATAVSSTPSFTWRNVRANVQSASNHTNASIWCADTGNTTPTTYTINVTVTPSPIVSDPGSMLIGLKNARSTSCADAVSGFAIGNKTGVTPIDVASGGVTSGSLSITPTWSDSFIVAAVPVDFNTVNAVTNGQFQSCFLSTNSSGNTPYCENNGAATMQNHAISAFEFNWALQSGLGPNTGEYVMAWAEFPAPGAARTNGGLMLTGVGQ